jgi:hypothetical protein
MRPPKLNQPEEAAMAATAETKVEMTKAQDAGATGPVVVDLGKKRRRQIKKLRRGQGKLMDEINHLVEELRTSGSIGSTTQPLVVVVRQKRRSRSVGWI